MSFVIKNVHVENFRAHESFTFEPDVKGVTVIKGENGTGKSSLIDAIAWCIYGIKPNGVSKNAELRRHHMDIDNEKTFVKVTIELPDASIFEIERRILGKKGNTECDVWHITVDDSNADNPIFNKEHVAGASVTHASEFIRSTVGINEKGFLASMFVQQKQVDELLTASPKDRSAVIEKMTGITALTDAVSDIRVDLRDAKKTMEIYGNDSQDYDVKTIKAEISEKSSELDSLNQQYANISSQGKAKKQEYVELKKLYEYQLDVKNRLDNERTMYSSVNNEYMSAQEYLTTSENSLSEKLASLASLEKELNGKTAQDVMTEYTQQQEKLSRAKYNLSSVESELEKQKNIVVHTVSTVNTLFAEDIISNKLSGELSAEYLDDVIAELDAKKSEKEQVIKSLKEKEEKIKESISTKDFIYNSNLSVKKALSNEDGECPTCHQKPDNLTELLSNLDDNNEALLKEKEDLESQKHKLEEEFNTSSNAIASISGYINDLEGSSSALLAVTDREKDYAQLKEDVAQLSTSVDNMQDVYSKANNVNSLNADISSLLVSVDKLKKQVEEKAQEVTEAKSRGKALSEEFKSFEGFDERKDVISALEEELEGLRAELSNVRVEKGKIESDVEYAKKNLEQAKSSQERYEKSVSEFEKVTSSSKMVSSFREKRIEEVVPEISMTASTLLSRFTDGKFVSMNLDKSYKAQVEQSDGVKVDVGLLSGGELSAVALSLRLAIALISQKGESATTMILDEVLVSQDENRVENIVTTIKDVLDGQVILIGHNGDVISSIADKIVELG